MSLPRLYHPELQPGSNRLSEEEFRHAVAARRLRAGDDVVLFDGAGREGRGIVESVERRSLISRVEHLEQKPFDAAHHLTLAVAMAKTHRQGYMVEKCTELGVAAIWPILAEHSVTRPGLAAVEKWSRRAVEAAKQSGRAWVPSVSQPRTFADAASRAAQFEIAAIADFADAAAPFASLLSRVPSGRPIIVFIGPEGGWTDSERSLASRCGIVTVRLAQTTLRAETAAVAACAAEAMYSAAHFA